MFKFLTFNCILIKLLKIGIELLDRKDSALDFNLIKHNTLMSEYSYTQMHCYKSTQDASLLQDSWIDDINIHGNTSKEHPKID